MRYLYLIGRILYSLIFLSTIMTHFSSQGIDYAGSKGVPAPGFLVPLAGIIAILGALSIILGYKTRWGAFFILVFLIPVTLRMHDFWNVGDPLQRQMQMAHFMKNISMLGASLIILYFGSGPLTIDKYQQKKTAGQPKV